MSHDWNTLIPGDYHDIVPQVRNAFALIEAMVGAGAVDLSARASDGDGSLSDPYTGWADDGFEVGGVYLYPSGHDFLHGHYALPDSVNFLKTNIAHIGIGGAFLHHVGEGDAFVMDSEDPGVLWIQRARMENLTILGNYSVMTGTATGAVGTNQIVGTGTQFLTELAVGKAVSFDSGTANCETRLVTAIADDTHATVSGNWTTNKSGAVRIGKTRHGIFMSGVRQAQLKNVTVHDVAHAALYTEWCVTNEATSFVTSYHDPLMNTEFNVRSQWGIKLGIGSTIWEFTNPVVEGTQAIGIYTLDGAYGHVFNGGTSEGNRGDGLFFHSDQNAVYGTDFEANEGDDVHVWGDFNYFQGAVIEQECFIEAGAHNCLARCQLGNVVNSGDHTLIDGGRVNGTKTDLNPPNGLLHLTYSNVLDNNGALVKIGNVVDWIKDLTPGATISTNARDARIFYFGSSTNFTLLNPTNAINGQMIEWRITQSAAHTITYDTKFRAAPGKTLPAMPTVTGQVLHFAVRYNSTDDKYDQIYSNNDSFSSFSADDITARDINATGGYSINDTQVLTSQQPEITDLTDSIGGTVSNTLAAIPNPADTPASADALRDDLVTNVLPKIRDALSSLAAKDKEWLDTARTHGLIAITPPFDISQVKAWYKAGTLTFGNGDPVTKFKDISGNARHLRQSDPAKCPLFVTGVIDGEPVLRFDGSNDELRSIAFSYNQPICVTMVVKRYNTDFKYFFSSIDGPGVAAFQGAVVSLFAGGAGDPSATIATGAFHLVTFEFNGSSSNIRVDGSVAGDSPGNPGSNNGNGFVLGNRYDSTTPSQIDVPEVVIHSPSILTDVETYLLAEYPSL